MWIIYAFIITRRLGKSIREDILARAFNSDWPFHIGCSYDFLGATLNINFFDLYFKLVISKGPSIKYVRKIFRKTNISNPLRYQWTGFYMISQGVRNVSFSENFAYVLNGWPPTLLIWQTLELTEKWHLSVLASILLF